MQARTHRLALTVALAACGPETADSADSGSSAATSSEDTGGTGDTDGTPTTGGEPAPAVCDGQESIDPFQAMTCEEFAREEPGPAIVVNIVNERDEVVFLRGFGNGAEGYLRLVGTAGGREVHFPFVCSIEAPDCDGVLAGELGCLAKDQLSPPMRIEPGGRVLLSWSPYIVFAVDIPESCGFSPDGTCTAGRRATPGAYTLSVTYTHADGCAGTCTCTVDANGSCVLDREEAMLTGTPLTVDAAYDGVCTTVDLVID